MTIQNCEQLIEKLKKDTDKLNKTDKTEKNWSLKITKVNETTENRLLSTNTTFEQMNLNKKVLEKLYEQKFDKPSEIQSVVIPEIIKSNNVVIQSESGSGKTISFVTAIANKIKNSIEGNNKSISSIHAIILTQTRELVKQMENVVKDICEDIITYTSIINENNNEIKIKPDYNNYNILIGTPGSLSYLIQKQGKDINWEYLETLIIDEADALLNLKEGGSVTLSVIMSLSSQVSNKKNSKYLQLCFFSATYTEKIINFIKKIFQKKDDMLKEKHEIIWMLKDNTKPNEICLYNIDIRNTNKDDEEIEDVFNKIKHLNLGKRLPTKRKLQTLVTLLDTLCMGQCIIFASTLNTVVEISEVLKANLSSVTMLHGKLTSQEREENILGFKTAKYKILVATNVLSRGLDIPQINLIINYDLPLIYEENIKPIDLQPDVETYIHRVGRSGRFGRTGFVIDFINSEKDKQNLKILIDSIKCESLNFTIDEFKRASVIEEESADSVWDEK